VPSQPSAAAPPAAHERAARRLRVAVLGGGRSSEHDVSLSSAAAVAEGLGEAGHEVTMIEVGRDGVWRRDGQVLAVTPGEGLPGHDLVFPVLHGPYGEDGSVQGLLESLGVPYVGAGVAASAVCMDKVLFKDLMATLGIPQVDYVGLRAEECRRDPAGTLAAAAAPGLPAFVKPAHLGSSVGIVKVTEPDHLEGALEEAFAHDARVIVEAMALGKEVECGVLGGSGGAPALASEPGEIVYGGEFYDYAAKYSPGGMELLIPPRISSGARERVRELATEVFRAVGCDGLARVDFFVHGERVLVNELNTMPGFTPTSVYAKLLAASGVAYPRLVDNLCRLALERHAEGAAYRC
jgi:D-alanine-D-alanine ligase